MVLGCSVGARAGSGTVAAPIQLSDHDSRLTSPGTLPDPPSAERGEQEEVRSRFVRERANGRPEQEEANGGGIFISSEADPLVRHVYV